MYKKLFSIFIFISLGVTLAQAQAPAFPGAEGHGRYVTGGRGVRYVMSLTSTTVEPVLCVLLSVVLLRKLSFSM